VSEPADGDKPKAKADEPKADEPKADEPKPAAKPEPEARESDGAIGKALDIPPTRRHETASPEPPVRPSQSNLDLHAPPSYPDDGALSGKLRQVDAIIGKVEQVVLVTLLGIITVVAGTHAILDRVAHIRLEFKDDVIRGGTFTIALLGAAFATQQARNLSMDLVSRRLSPRGRLVLGVVLKAFTIALSGVLVYIGLYLHDHAVPGGPVLDLTFVAITEKDALCVIPLGGALIVLHSLLHAAIELEYLVLGKLPPERARSGH
jgi:TRAP-type C4-dicarboxylate transport system permease small subunit